MAVIPVHDPLKFKVTDIAAYLTAAWQSVGHRSILIEFWGRSAGDQCRELRRLE